MIEIQPRVRKVLLKWTETKGQIWIDNKSGSLSLRILLPGKEPEIFEIVADREKAGDCIRQMLDIKPEPLIDKQRSLRRDDGGCYIISTLGEHRAREAQKEFKNPTPFDFTPRPIFDGSDKVRLFCLSRNWKNAPLGLA